MLLGKRLRLRRIFGHGRAIIGLVENPLGPGADSPAHSARVLERSGADAVCASPGTVQLIADELSDLALVVRLNLPVSRRELLTPIDTALAIGAEAVLITADPADPHDCALLTRTAAEAFSAGLPLIADMLGEDSARALYVASELGADVIGFQADLTDAANLRQILKHAARPVFARAPAETGMALARCVHALLEMGVQAIAVDRHSEEDLGLIRGLVHQGAPLSLKMGA